MEDNLNTLKNIKNIVKIKRIELTDEIKKLLGPKYIEEAEINSKKLFAYSIFYKSKGKTIAGYIVEPREGNNLPCIIWNRGGSREIGAIKIGQLFVNQSTIPLFASNGYIVIISQYPGVAGGEGLHKMGSEEDIYSILDLYKILKQYKRANSKNIGMYGMSLGGMMTYMCLSKVKWLKAAIAISAPTDEVNAPKFRKGWKEHQKLVYGGSLKEKIKRSVIYWANKLNKKTPLWIIHGSSDWRVNPKDTIKLAEKLIENKVPYRLIIYEGADHQISEFRKELHNELINWFNRFLRNNERLPNLKPHGQ